MADAGKTGSSCEGEHCIRHFAWTKARKSSTTVRTDLRKYNNRLLSPIGTRTTSKKCAIKNELGKSMSETDGDCDHVLRQAMDTGKPQDIINAISQFGQRRKTHLMWQKPASQDGHTDNGGALEYHGIYVHSSAKHYLWWVYAPHYQKVEGRIYRTFFLANWKNCSRNAILEIKKIHWSEIFLLQICKILKFKDNYLEKLSNHPKPYVWPYTWNSNNGISYRFETHIQHRMSML